MQAWRGVVLLVAVWGMIAACAGTPTTGSSAPQTSPSATARCVPAAGTGDVITTFAVVVQSGGRASALYTLARDADVGILVQRGASTAGPVDPLLVGRVPLGFRRAAMAQVDDFALPVVGGEPLGTGEHGFTLRAFEVGQLNVGTPIATASVCATVE